jgi:iron complex transport system substrate-binding protein
MRSRRALGLAVLLLAGALRSVSAQESPESRETGRGDGPAGSSARRDALGVVLPEGPPPQRIVSLSPNLTEILFAVGVRRDRIAGVTSYCDFPPEVAGLPRVGGIVDPSIETILALRPDLVLATRGNPAAVIDRLRAARVAVYAFDSQDGVDAILDSIRRMISIVSPDDTTRAAGAVRSFTAGLECLRSIGRGIAETARPRVYYHDPVSPDWTAGPGTHVSEAIRIAGGVNIGDDASFAWPRLSIEYLVARRPEFLLVAAQGGDTSAAARAAVLADLRGKPGWRDLPAVREGRLCLVPADWLLRPGPRIIPAIRMIGRCLHPEGAWGCAG